MIFKNAEYSIRRGGKKMVKKKSFEAVNNKRKYEKKGKRKGEKYDWKTVTESDFKELQKEYPYLQKDINGIFYIDRQGQRKTVYLPYIPIIDDDSCLRVVYKKPYGKKCDKFPFQVIDNMKHITKVFVNEDTGEIMRWRISPNKDKDKIKDGNRIKNYSKATAPGRLPKRVIDLVTKDDAKMHKVIMALTFPGDMQEYRKGNDKKIASQHIDHVSNNEYDCRIRNMWFTEKRTNWKGKKKIDKATLLDRICVYRKKDANEMPIYTSQKFVFIMMLGNYTKAEWESLGESKKVQEDNRINGKSQYNFIEYRGEKGNIICAMFSTLRDAENWYKKIIVENGEKAENVAERNERIRASFERYLNNNEEIQGLEKMVLLADTNETADGYIEFDDITNNIPGLIKAKKRGLVVEIKEEQREKSKRYVPVVKDIANLKLNSDNVIDILFPYFDKIFEN